MADTYWLRRQRRSDERMARRERSLEGRVRRVYERELRDLEREIADYYERYGEDGVLRYRTMLQTMDEADRRLLIEDCEEFARQHPDLADMVEIRKSIYQLDRLEGLRTSVRYHLAQATAEATSGLDDHFAADAADAMNAVAETMGYGSSFYSADSEVARQFVGTAWSDGKSYSDSIWDDAREVASYVERDLAKALVRGASYQSLCREMQKRFEGQSVSNIMRVVQTEGTYVARQAQGAEMQREGFEEYFIDPLGDKRTCKECLELGRQSHETPFRFEDAEVGTNYPPIHPRCRCEVNPAVEDWDEWLRKRRAERRAQAAASEVSDEAVAKRFGGVEVEYIGRPLGAQFIAPRVRIPRSVTGMTHDVETHLTHGSKLWVAKKVLAGRGSPTKIRDSMERLRREYPDVPASSWQKRCGKGYIDDMGLSRLVELHWYEAPEIGRVEMKVKRFL